jgi:mxaA protein
VRETDTTDAATGSSPGVCPRAALLLVLLAWSGLSQPQAILAYEVIEPRSFGYVVGDKVRREMRLSLHTGYRLDEASLPEAGRLDRWLEVAAPDISAEPVADGLRYRIVLTYQIFNAPQALSTVTIPQQDLRIAGAPGEGQHAFTTLIPALRITVAPVTSGLDAGRLSEASLQADRAPVPLPVEARQSRVAWTCLALLVLLLYAAWRRGLMGFIAGGKLPFASAVRALRSSRPAAGAAADCAAAFRIVHDAINTTAGRAVFAHNLDDFLAAHPAYAGLRDDFRQLFAVSRRFFFAGEAGDAAPIECRPELLRLCRRCSRIERRVQRPVWPVGHRPSGKVHAPGD